jgi:hypothetical protein
MKFDVILINSPFNADRNFKTKINGKVDRYLWPIFTKLALSLLKENGYLANIHPGAWRKPFHELWSILSSKQIYYLEMHNSQDGLKIFKSATEYDWYILQNTNIYKETEIVDWKYNKFNIKLDSLPFLPHYNLDNIFKVININKKDSIEIIRLRGYDKNRSKFPAKKNNIFKYPIILSLQQGNPVVVHSNIDKGGIGISKVILNNAGKIKSYNDFNGKYGFSCWCFGIKVNSKIEAENITKATSSEEFNNFIKCVIWAMKQPGLDYRIVKYFKKDFWKYFVNKNRKEI